MTVPLTDGQSCYVTFVLQVNTAHLLNQHSGHCPFQLLQFLIIRSVQQGEDQHKEDVLTNRSWYISVNMFGSASS